MTTPPNNPHVVHGIRFHTPKVSPDSGLIRSSPAKQHTPRDLGCRRGRRGGRVTFPDVPLDTPRHPPAGAFPASNDIPPQFPATHLSSRLRLSALPTNLVPPVCNSPGSGAPRASLPLPPLRGSETCYGRYGVALSSPTSLHFSLTIASNRLVNH